jgi:hypothetical protein
LDGVAGEGISMEVFVKRDGRWLMEAFHNIDLAAPK